MPVRNAARLLFRHIPRVVIGVIILIAIAINFANIVGRYVFLAPLPWAEEVLVFLVIWGVCVGASAVTYDDRHLDMDLLVRLFSPKIQTALEVLKVAVLVGFCAFTLVNAWAIVVLMARNEQVSIAAGVPMTVPYLAFVVGFGFMLLAAIAGAVERYLESASERDLSSGR
jgi:TRAP-type C4-dicarboxylate transport system permease small subunit